MTKDINPDDLTQAATPDSPGFFNEATLSAVQKNQKLEKELDMKTFELHLAEKYPWLDSREERLQQWQQERREDIQNYLYSDEALEAAVEHDKKMFEDAISEEPSAEADYIRRWNKHRKETRGEW